MSYSFDSILYRFHRPPQCLYVLQVPVCMHRVLDMLRYSKFTIGHAWIPEYGDAQKPEHLEFLMRYSPVHVAPESSALAVATERLRSFSRAIRETRAHCGDEKEDKAHCHQDDQTSTLSAQYPALLLLTGDHDDRVVRSHSLFDSTASIHKLPVEMCPVVCRCLFIATSSSLRFNIALGISLNRLALFAATIVY